MAVSVLICRDLAASLHCLCFQVPCCLLSFMFWRLSYLASCIFPLFYRSYGGTAVMHSAAVLC